MRHDRSQAADRSLVVAFVAMLLVPAAVLVVTPSATTDDVQNRALAAAPALPLTLASALAFPQQFTDYWNDHFGLRAELTWLYSNALYHGLGSVPFGKVRVHADGWVFAAIENYRDCKSLQEPQQKREAMVSRMLAMGEATKARGLHYVVMLVPSKHFVYRPDAPGLSCPPNEGPAHLVSKALKARGASFPVLDPLQRLAEARTRHPVYYRTDLHWNDHGAFIGYQMLMETLRHWYPQLRADPLDDFTQVVRTHAAGGLARIASLALEDEQVTYLERRTAPRARRLPGPAPQGTPPFVYDGQPVRYATDDPDAPRLLVFRDSFARQLKAWLPEHFRETTFVWSEGTPELLAEYPTDIVVEVHLYGGGPSQERALPQRRPKP
jgi:hypothetical protein